jgi:hypothetical protein
MSVLKLENILFFNKSILNQIRNFWNFENTIHTTNTYFLLVGKNCRAQMR